MKKKSNFFNWLKKHAKKGVLAAVLAVMFLSPCFAFLGGFTSYNADAIGANDGFTEFLPFGGADVYFIGNSASAQNSDATGAFITYPIIGTRSELFSNNSYQNTVVNFTLSKDLYNGRNTYALYWSNLAYLGSNDDTNKIWFSLELDNYLIPVDVFLTMLNNTRITLKKDSNDILFFVRLSFFCTGRIYRADGSSVVFGLDAISDGIDTELSDNSGRIKVHDFYNQDSMSAYLDFSDIITYVPYGDSQANLFSADVLSDYVFFSSLGYDWLFFESFRIAVSCYESESLYSNSYSINLSYFSYPDTFISYNVQEARTYLFYDIWEQYRTNNIVDFYKPILGFVEDFFNMEIFPNFRISYILMLGVGALIFGFALKFFLGG